MCAACSRRQLYPQVLIFLQLLIQTLNKADSFFLYFFPQIYLILTEESFSDQFPYHVLRIYYPPASLLKLYHGYIFIYMLICCSVVLVLRQHYLYAKLWLLISLNNIQYLLSMELAWMVRFFKFACISCDLGLNP